MRTFKTGMLVLCALIACADQAAAASYINDFSETQQDRTAPLPRIPEISCQNGTVEISTGLRINAPSDFCFIDKAAASKILVEDWGNPTSITTNVIGMLLPRMPSSRRLPPFVLRFNPVGYVADPDGDDLDHDAVLHFLKLDNIRLMAEQTRNRSTIFRISNWFTKPRYDRATRTWHLPIELGHGATEEKTLHYWLLQFGRDGFVSAHVIGADDRREEVIAAAAKLQAMIEFSEPYRHADYQPVNQAAAFASLKELFVPIHKYRPSRGRVATEISLSEVLLMIFAALLLNGAGARYWFLRKMRASSLPLDKRPLRTK
jgi:uncharacterized membrane-anchored protein